MEFMPCHARRRLNSESGERKRTESESSVGTTETKRKRSGDSESDQRQRNESESSETREETTTSTMTTKSRPPTMSSDPGWDDDFNPFGGGEMTSPRKSSEETEEGHGSPMKKKVKTHISKKEKKALDKMEAEEIAREEMSTFRTTI